MKLSKTADPQYLIDNWAKNVQTTLQARPKKFTGYSESKVATSKDKSLNDVVFEAMGSQRNAEDFVLCESGINSFKAKLWADQEPFQASRWQKIAKDAANGAVPSREHFQGLRTALAVYDYINEPGVTKRMRDTIANVKTELSGENLAHLFGSKPKDSSKTVDYDLAAMWIEYMNKQLTDFKEKGKTWLTAQIKHALPLYEKEVKELEAALKKINDEVRMKPDLKKKTENARVTKYNKMVTETNGLKARRDRAHTNLVKDEAAFDAARKLVEKAKGTSSKDAAKKSSGYTAKQKKLAASKITFYSAQVAAGTKERDTIKLDKQDLTAVLKEVREDVTMMKWYKVEAGQLKVPKAE